MPPKRKVTMPIEVKSFASQADEAKDMPNARMEAVNVLGQRVMKLTLAPDWKWSTDIKPIVGTPSCQATHTGIIIEGTIHCVCDDGSEATYSAGMHMRFHQIMTHGASVENERLCTSLPEHGENRNVVIPETNKSHG